MLVQVAISLTCAFGCGCTLEDGEYLAAFIYGVFIFLPLGGLFNER
jgi:hypothetical protein